MPIQQYELSEDAQFDAHPDMEFIVPRNDGEYVKFSDVRQLINQVYDNQRDFGSSEADGAVFDTIEELLIAMGIDTTTEMKR